MPSMPRALLNVVFVLELACASSSPPAHAHPDAGLPSTTAGALPVVAGAGAGASATASFSGSGSAAGGAGATASGGMSGRGLGGTGAAGYDGGVAISAWHTASLTNFTSYPDPGSDECVKYNGCMWAGQFAAIDGTQTEAWVAAHNIVAVHSKDFATYRLKTLRLRRDGKQIDVTVYDECADSDCSGCCTQNAKPSGFLIDIESYTAMRFGVSDGQVDWACLDCP